MAVDILMRKGILGIGFLWITPRTPLRRLSLERGRRILYRPCILCALLALVLGAISSGGCGDGTSERGADAESVPVEVSLVAATRQPVQRVVEVVGTLWGEEDITISNKVPGKVIAVYADVGDRVEPGEALAQLLRNDYELTRAQRESALAEVLAKLGLEEVPTADFNPSNLPAVRRARLQAANAQGRFERGKQLHDQDPPLMSDQDFADLETARDVAQSAYEVELLTARSLVAEARTRQAELRISEQALADTSIRAPRPMTGPEETPSAARTGENSFAVAERQIEVGELLSALTPMFRLVDDDPLKLRAQVPERFVPDVKVGQMVQLTVESYPGREFEGKVTRVRPQIDPANRTFSVEISVPNPDRPLRAGAFARGRIATRTEEAVFVPAAAIASFAGVSRVFTVKDGKASEITVQLGRTQGDRVEVVSGLKEGESIVAKDAEKLASGIPVTVADQTAADATASPAPAPGGTGLATTPTNGE